MHVSRYHTHKESTSNVFNSASHRFSIHKSEYSSNTRAEGASWSTKLGLSFKGSEYHSYEDKTSLEYEPTPYYAEPAPTLDHFEETFHSENATYGEPDLISPTIYSFIPAPEVTDQPYSRQGTHSLPPWNEVMASQTDSTVMALHSHFPDESNASWLETSYSHLGDLASGMTSDGINSTSVASHSHSYMFMRSDTHVNSSYLSGNLVNTTNATNGPAFKNTQSQMPQNKGEDDVDDAIPKREPFYKRIPILRNLFSNGNYVYADYQMVILPALMIALLFIM